LGHSVDSSIVTKINSEGGYDEIHEPSEIKILTIVKIRSQKQRRCNKVEVKNRVSIVSVYRVAYDLSLIIGVVFDELRAVTADSQTVVY